LPPLKQDGSLQAAIPALQERYHETLSAPVKTNRLKETAQRFQHDLQAAKKRTPLVAGINWYPWTSLAQMDILDSFLGGDTGALLNLIGDEPVLDVGCADGDVAFFLESLGARVDAVDYAPTNYNAFLGIRALKETLGSRIGIHSVDLDTRPHLPGGGYGLAMMLGVLYHLKNPFLVLETLARHARYMFLSTRIASLAPDRKTRLSGLPVAYLVEEDELNHDYTNYWIFSEEGLKRIVRRAGWDVTHYVAAGPVDTSDPSSQKNDARAYLLARSRLAAPKCEFRPLEGWHPVEQGSWRWTERRFSLQLDLSEARSPATFRFLFHLPGQAFKDRSAITLRVKINGKELAPAVYTVDGEHEFTATLEALPAGAATVACELDYAIPPSDTDQRELGVLVDLTGASPVSV
jgi:tRNA (mo5U34)-methyltransferase